MAIALINSGVKGGDGVDATTDAINMTGSDLLVMMNAYRLNSGTTTPDLSDSQSNTWTKSAFSGSGATGMLMAYVEAPSVGASQTFTQDNDGTFRDRASMAAAGFSGLHASPADQQGGGGNSTNNATLTLSSITPTVDGCLIVSAIAIDRAVTNMAVTGGSLSWATPVKLAFSSSPAYNELYWTYAIQTTAAAVAVKYDWTTNAVKSARCWSFKPAVAAGVLLTRIEHAVGRGAFRGVHRGMR